MKNIVIGILICCLFSCSGNQKPDGDYNSKDTLFDAFLWKCGSRHLRGRMVKSLIKRKVLNGISPDSVIRALGNPDSEKHSIFSYTLSTPDTALLINWQILYVKVDSASNKVTNAWVSD